MEEMSLKELFEMFWKKKIQILLIIAFFCIIGSIYSYSMTKSPKFKSTTSLLLVTNSPDYEIEKESTTSNSKLIATFGEIVKTNRVLEKVKSNLQIDVSVNDIRNGVSATGVQGTYVIKISVINQDATLAAKIANETAKVFIETTKEFYETQKIYVIDEAVVVENAIEVNHFKNISIFTFLGIIIATIYVFVARIME